MTNFVIEENSILEEYKKAKREGRQPNCPFCGQPLEIAQTQSVDIRWIWEKEKGTYTKGDSDGDADKPYCVHCEARDWDFIDFDLVNF